MELELPSIGIALIAGLVSFVSPCVLPLVPAYIGYMGGRVTHTVASQVAIAGEQSTGRSIASRFNTALHSIAFILGFTVVFITLGIALTGAITAVSSASTLITDVLGRVGGVIIIFFGLHFMGIIPRLFAQLRRGVKQESTESGTVTYSGGIVNHIGFSLLIGVLGSLLLWWGFVEPLLAIPILSAFILALLLGGAFTEPARFWLRLMGTFEALFYADTRRELTADGKGGLTGSFFMGVVFSAGWTPCIGPIYGSVLNVTAQTGNVGQALPILAAYVLGLGIPFFLTALLLDGAQGILRTLQRHIHKIELVSGIFLVIIGLLVASGQLQSLSSQFATGELADASIRVETCVVEFFDGSLPLGLVGPCLGGSVTPITLNNTEFGGFDGPDWQLEYVFHAEAGHAVDVHVGGFGTVFIITDVTATSPTPNTNDSPTVDSDIAVILRAPDGETLLEADVTGEVERGARVLVFENVTLPADGLYTVVISNLQDYVPGERRTFNIRVRDHQPEATTTSEGDTDTTPPTNETETGENTGGVGTISGLAADSDAIVGLDIGDIAPNFETVTDTGEPVRLWDLHGRVVVLNFWGTWCGPCRREMPIFQQIWEERGERDNFTIVAVAARDTVEQVQTFRDEFDLTFTLAMDTDDSISFGLYQIYGQPVTMILDVDGIIVAQHLGIMLYEQLNELLDETLS